MKNLTVILGVLLLMASQVSGKNLQAHLSYATFYSPEEGPYIETYLSINPNSINYKKTAEGDFKGAVEITLIFKQGEKISAFDKYVLNSPVLEDTANISQQFIDLKRFVLPKGEYNFSISISDKNSLREPYIASEKVSLKFDKNRVQFSDVQMVDSYEKTEKQNILTKSGYDLIPYPSNFYPENKNSIIFYSELYNTKKVLGASSRFLLKFYLQSASTRQPLQDYVKIRRMESKPVHTIFHKFDMSEIPSGNYNLVLEVFNERNEMIANKKAFIQRSNPSIAVESINLADVDVSRSFAVKYTDKEELIDYIRGLKPLSTRTEKTFIDSRIEDLDIEVLQRFLFSFWSERNALNPEKEWDKYKKHLATVNREFKSMVKKGYETDRGEIFLRYGPPNAILRSYNEPSAYPYEIWKYYQTGKYRDSKFVFYTHDMVTNDFELVHSTVPGEVNNRKWQYAVFGRIVTGGNVDDGQFNLDNVWGSRGEYYEDPY